jgi:hypothetical protein
MHSACAGGAAEVRHKDAKMHAERTNLKQEESEAQFTEQVAYSALLLRLESRLVHQVRSEIKVVAENLAKEVQQRVGCRHCCQCCADTWVVPQVNERGYSEER